MLWIKIKEIRYTPKSQLFYIKVGYKGVYISWTCFRDDYLLCSEALRSCLLIKYHRDSRQEFEKVGGIFPILHVVFLLDASN